VITENIHTIPWEFQGGFLGIGGDTYGVPNVWGIEALNFLRGKMANYSFSSLNLVTLPVCRSRINRPWKVDKDISGTCWQ